MRELPRDPTPDATAALFVEGYEFVSRRCTRLGTDAFRTRLQLQPTICLRGRDAAELFYGSDRLQRAGAAPRRLRKTLFGEGGVQGLDGAAHRRRKQLFLALMSPERLRELAFLAGRRWRDRVPAWSRAGRVQLHGETSRVLNEAVHAWAGVPLTAVGSDRRRRDLEAMIVGGGGLGPNYGRGRVGRWRGERQLARLVEDVRAGRLEPEPDRALAAVAWFRDADGRLLDPRTAAVELLNVLRPTVAVDRYVTLAALALHQHPHWHERLASSDDEEAVERFVHEVRRRYPFFPFAAARVRQEFTWRGYRFPAGWRVLLDLYGTGHDPAVFAEPTAFRPERYAERPIGPFDLVPQGGGDHAASHRCAGEWATLRLVCDAVGLLTREIRYDVPDQDLRLARGKIPALPASGFLLSSVRART